jgi:quercetin dioxygenase-like cupin family protein
MGSVPDAGGERRALVKYLDAAVPIPCPYGHVRRVVTGGEGGVANVHVVTVSNGSPHSHAAYDEVYYVLSGTGHLEMSGERHLLRPGAVAVIPAGVVHALNADTAEPLTFVIFGAPAMPVDDPRAKPVKPA